MIEVTRELSANSTKIDRLIKDVEKTETSIGGLKKSFYVATGVVVASGILFSLFGTFLWFLLGNQMTAVKDELLRKMPPPATVTRQP